MALQADVQKLVDAVAANTDAVASAVAGLKAEQTQIAAQATQIKDLQDQLAALTPGQPIDSEDLAAIQKTVTDLAANNATLGETNTSLQTAVPTNVKP